MTENQSILKPMGLFDTLSAERLLGRIRERSSSELTVDCSGITRSLYESLKIFIARVDAMHPEAPGEFRLKFQRIPGGMARQLQLLGRPVTRDSAIIFPPGSGVSRTRETAVRMVQCDNCANPVRIGRPGNFACPHCSVRFHVNKFGNASFYEPMLDAERR